MNRLRLAIVVVLLALVFAARAGAQVGGTQTFSLEEALQYALDHYPTLRVALEQANAATANVDVARSIYLPRFDAFWQTNRATANNTFGLLLPQSALPSISGPVLTSPSSDSVWGSAVGGLLTWEPFDFGLRGSSVREAEAGVRRARADEGLTRLGVQNAVAMAFLAVVSAQQALAAAEADIQRRDVLARAARVLTDNQLRPGAEASRAEAELAAARTRAIQARQAVMIARTTLGQMLGIPGGVVDVNASRLLDTIPPDATLSASTAEHPLLQSTQAAVDLARARETVLAKTDYPRVYFQSSVFGRGSGGNPDGTFDGGADGLGPDRANWAAGVQVLFPNVFDFSSLHARQAAASALTRAEGARYDESVLAVSAQQRAAEAMVDAARAIAQNTPIQLAAAQQSEAQARARYDAGLAGIVEVAEAQNLLAGAEFQNGVARIDVWRSLLARAIAQGNIAPFIELLRASGVK
jgi:outer membrane protein TolC